MKEFSEKRLLEFIYKKGLRVILYLMKKTILFFMQIFLIFSAGTFFLNAQPMMQPRHHPPAPPGMNFNGHRMPPRSENFSVIGLKIEERGELFTLSIFFNAPLDSNSVEAKNILINGNPLHEGTEFLFNRSRHMTRFSIPKMPEDFSLTLMNLRSFDGKIMNSTEISSLEANSFCKFSREAHTWQKSSL